MELKMLFSNKGLFRLILIVLGVVVICGIDLSVKSVMAELLEAPTGTIELTPFFNLTLTYNTGVSFGLFSDCQRRSKILPRGGAKVGHLWRAHETAGRA